MATMPLRVGIVGCGAFGREAYALNLADHPDADIAALCDSDRARAKTLAGDLVAEQGVDVWGTHGFASLAPLCLLSWGDGEYVDRTEEVAPGLAASFVDDYQIRVRQEAHHFIDCALGRATPIVSEAEMRTDQAIMDGIYGTVEGETPSDSSFEFNVFLIAIVFSARDGGFQTHPPVTASSPTGVPDPVVEGDQITRLRAGNVRRHLSSICERMHSTSLLAGAWRAPIPLRSSSRLNSLPTAPNAGFLLNSCKYLRASGEVIKRLFLHTRLSRWVAELSRHGLALWGQSPGPDSPDPGLSLSTSVGVAAYPIPVSPNRFPVNQQWRIPLQDTTVGYDRCWSSKEPTPLTPSSPSGPKRFAQCQCSPSALVSRWTR